MEIKENEHLKLPLLVQCGNQHVQPHLKSARVLPLFVLGHIVKLKIVDNERLIGF